MKSQDAIGLHGYIDTTMQPNQRGESLQVIIHADIDSVTSVTMASSTVACWICRR
jgi:hypothetical protein